MQLAGVLLYRVAYGFEADRLVDVEVDTFPENPVDDSCFDTKATKAITKKMATLFGERIRHIGDYSSSAEEFRMNVADHRDCVDRFPRADAVACEVDVLEWWGRGAKETDRALESSFQIVSFGRSTVNSCIVRLVLRPGRTLAEKLAQEKSHETLTDDLIEAMGR